MGSNFLSCPIQKLSEQETETRIFDQAMFGFYLCFFNSSFKKGFNLEENNLCHIETYHLYFPKIPQECKENNLLENAKLFLSNHHIQPKKYREKLKHISFITIPLLIGTHLSLRSLISFCFKCTCIAKTKILANIS